MLRYDGDLTLHEYLRALAAEITKPKPLVHIPGAAAALMLASKIIARDNEPRNFVPLTDPAAVTMVHPLLTVFNQGIQQLTTGKGTRHGGDTTPFFEQRWFQLSGNYGSGGLFFQADKKLQEAQQKTGEDRKRELLGALNYLAMGILFEEQQNG